VHGCTAAGHRRLGAAGQPARPAWRPRHPRDRLHRRRQRRRPRRTEPRGHRRACRRPRAGSPRDAAIRLALPDGTPVGTARIAVTARPWNPLAALDPGWSDQAILTLTRFDSPTAEAAFPAAPGQPPPPAASPSARCSTCAWRMAAALHRDCPAHRCSAPEGRVRGILVQRRIEDWSGSASAEAPLPRRGIATRLEPAREGWVQPLAAPAILAALGPAGRAVDTLAVPGDDDLFVLAPGYPGGRCAVVSAGAAYRPAPALRD
jgi:hypothetical protein